MSAPTTAVDSIYVQISWTQPASNGASIIGNRVYVQDKTGVFKVETKYCSESDAVIVSQQYCNIPMSYLTGPTYNLVKGDIVIAKVQASNSNGFGSLSTSNSVGAIIESVPNKMSSPTRGSLTSENYLQVQWSSITSGTSASGG